jgi:VCBS repeat-containing protein
LLTATPVALSHGQSAIISVEVEIPAAATGSDSFSLVVTSAGYGDLLLTAEVTTDVTVAPALELTADVTSGWGAAGGTLTYNLTVTNTGTHTDTFTVTLAGHSWQTVAQPESVGPLAPGESATVQVAVTVGAGQADNITVRLTSELDEAVWAEVVLTSQTHLLFLPLVLRP